MASQKVFNFCKDCKYFRADYFGFPYTPQFALSKGFCLATHTINFVTGEKVYKRAIENRKTVCQGLLFDERM